MVLVELTKEEIIIIKGALSISTKDEFGNDIDNNVISKTKELQTKLSVAWSL
jgi:hypothetical protein